MPFTISHAAAVLPFSRTLARWRLLCAAVIGSMVPDFGFLMPFRPPRIETHSAIGLLTFCLPMGLITFWIFQRLIKTPIMEVLPDAAYLRWRPFAEPADIGSLRQWVLAAFGVVAGAVTHLVWDGFTHEGARGVRMIPALDDPIVDIGGHRIIGARLLQDFSSLIGLIVVLAIIAYGLRRRRTDTVPLERTMPPGERSAWILAYVLTSIMLGILGLLAKHSFHPLRQPLGFVIGSFAIAALRSFAAALVVISLCLRVRLRANP